MEDLISVQCKMRTVDCRLRTGVKCRLKVKIQTVDFLLIMEITQFMYT